VRVGSVESDIGTVSASSFADISKSYSDNDPIKILLLGSSDLRHVLKTASRLNRKKEKRPVHVLERISTLILSSFTSWKLNQPF
jgi:hypothetical protein